jgi:hypothetical protein
LIKTCWFDKFNFATVSDMINVSFIKKKSRECEVLHNGSISDSFYKIKKFLWLTSGNWHQTDKLLYNMNRITFQQAIETLKSMFSHMDAEVLTMVLESNGISIDNYKLIFGDISFQNLLD